MTQLYMVLRRAAQFRAWLPQSRPAHPNQATSAEIVTTETTVEIRIAWDVTAASRSCSLASMNGPVPVGSAPSSTAASAQSGGIANTQ